jgi:simple sugar transport system ATP-binding protein
VLGIAGVEGNGQTELVETIMGMRHARTRAGSSSDAATNHPVGHLEPPGGWDRVHPQKNRTRHGLLATQPLWANRILASRNPAAPVARPGPLVC